jgi:hypothetical protein
MVGDSPVVMILKDPFIQKAVMRFGPQIMDRVVLRAALSHVLTQEIALQRVLNFLKN